MHKKVFAPALFDCLKSYSGKQFAKDAVSGVIVAIIALPLSIALALASGAALTVLGIWSSRAVLVMMGTPEDVLGPAASARSRVSTPPLSRAF